jgi:AcrR family transcriptional regulator
MAPGNSVQQFSPRARQIIAAAQELLEQEGLAGLSMRRIADRLGIRAPSLYEHIPNKQSLEAALISEGFAEWAQLAENAVRNSGDPLAALSRVYRDYATNHPHLYRLMTEGSLPRDELAAGIEERAALPLIAAAGGDADLARAVWAFAHGMLILELDGRFPPEADLDAAWRSGLAAFRASSSTRAASRP